jgi:uncharacterized protein
MKPHLEVSFALRCFQRLGNYHFFRNEKKYFIYDMLNNILLTTNNIEEQIMLKSVLKKFSNGEKITDAEKKKFNLLLSNFSDTKNVFHTREFLNKEKMFTTKITLMIAQTCNLKCTYCYGKEGRFGTEGEYMSKEVAEQSIRYLVKRIESLELKESKGLKESEAAKYFQITFFGGEPLLNFNLMKHVIEFAEQTFPDKVFSYTFTTNGTLFTQKIIDFVKSKKITIMLSLDGTQEIHDANRLFLNNRGSFEKVMKNIFLLKKNEINFAVRATLSTKFYKHYEDIVQFFTEIGAEQIFISKLIDYNMNSTDFDINVDDLKQELKYVLKYNNRIKNEILQGNNPFYIPFISLLERIHVATDSMISCGSLKGSTAVSWNGDLYPCHRFVRIEGFKFGNVYDGIDDTAMQDIVDKFDNATTECNDCWARFICERGCMRDIAKNNGCFVSYDKQYCDLVRKNIEWALETYYEIMKFQPDFFKQYSNKEIGIYNFNHKNC